MDLNETPIETEDNRFRKYTGYEVLVNDLVTAWSFIMSHIDEFKTPNIEIVGELGSWDVNELGEFCEPYVKYRTNVSGDVEGGW